MQVPTVDLLGQYLRIHLIGSAAGVELFGRGEKMPDRAARDVVRGIRDGVAAERRWLIELAGRLGHRRAAVTEGVVKVGERLGRLKPNGHPTRRTALTDVVDLEGMMATVHVKRVGWDSLLTCVDELDDDTVADLRRFREQADRQLQQLDALHADAARAAFAGRFSRD